MAVSFDSEQIQNCSGSLWQFSYEAKDPLKIQIFIDIRVLSKVFGLIITGINVNSLLSSQMIDGRVYNYSPYPSFKRSLKFILINFLKGLLKSFILYRFNKH